MPKKIPKTEPLMPTDWTTAAAWLLDPAAESFIRTLRDSADTAQVLCVQKTHVGATDEARTKAAESFVFNQVADGLEESREAAIERRGSED